MLPRGKGTLLFTGATASLRGSARFANLASPKFALRALAQSMARELGPQGLHVAHVIIDGQIGPAGGPDTRLDPDAIAALYVALHRQPRSAWTHEADLRPWSEKF
jgi:NAD(P)-dependent dehydrogenase (short-subunit alcohol dehydrogenase family)